MKYKQQALRMRFSPRSKSYIWLRNSKSKDRLPGEQLATTFKEPTNLGLCAVELPNLPTGYEFCDSLEEADKVYGTEIAATPGAPTIKLMWFYACHVLEHDLIFAYAKKKPETREEYLKRTMPEGYEWLGRGISTALIARFPNGFIGRAAWHDDWDARDSTLRGSDDNLYYCCKKETREEYLKRTVPEGYEWVGVGTADRANDPNFIGRAISVDAEESGWAHAIDSPHRGNSRHLYYIRKIGQPRPKFDPQAGSKWEHKNGGVFTIEQLDSGKYLLLSPGSLYLFAPAAHCIKDAFGGREAEFTEVK